MIKLVINIIEVQPAVFDMFNKYSFPGNIRELRNIMERAIILCTDNVLKPENFSIINSFSKQKNTNTIESYDLEVIEKQTILNALQKANNNKAEAARLLNIEWNALYRRLQKFNIEI